MSAPKAKADRPCRKLARLKKIIANEERERDPLLTAYLTQRQEAIAVAETLKRVQGRGDPIPLPSDTLPIMG